MIAVVRLRQLAVRDLPMLHTWLNAAHLRPYYMQSDISHEDVVGKFAPRLAPEHAIRCRIAHIDGRDFGYLQWYASRRWPDCGAMKVGVPNSSSIDYFIGEPEVLGRGLGRHMLLACSEQIFSDAPGDERIAVIAHENANVRARRTTERAGFVQFASYRDGAKACSVYRCSAAAHTQTSGDSARPG